MSTFNYAEMRDKVYACWMGKNIGGTLGTPYEGKRELNDVKGFATKPGETLINDDLDLQLVWLLAVENLGPRMINERVLGEYWLTYITPHWNEYGVGKSNMRDGLMPQCRVNSIMSSGDTPTEHGFEPKFGRVFSPDSPTRL